GVTYADSSSLTFAYDPNGLLTSVTDQVGKVLESHTYDSLRKGLTSQKAGSVDQLSVSYSGKTATLTDSAGNATAYGAQTLSGRNYVNSIAGSGCNSCGGR